LSRKRIFDLLDLVVGQLAPNHLGEERATFPTDPNCAILGCQLS